MRFDSIRQILKPLFGVHRRELIASFLKAIIASVILVVALMFLLRQAELGMAFDSTLVLLWSNRSLKFMEDGFGWNQNLDGERLFSIASHSAGAWRAE